MRTYARDRDAAGRQRVANKEVGSTVVQARTSHRILLVEDDEGTSKTVREFLERAGHRVTTASDGPTAVREATFGNYDIVLLDLSLPGVSGEEVLERLVAERQVPTIVVTGRLAETERVRLLDLGADDYMTKPLSLPELEARVRAVLRRATRVRPPARLDYGDLVIDRDTRRVYVEGTEVELTAKEFDLLAFLAASPDRVFSREELLEHVWGSTRHWQDPATITEHVRRLRLKIERDPTAPRWLHTVRNVGYRFVDATSLEDRASARRPGRSETDRQRSR
jgi:DNA-binding response OmpR family regulator